MGSRHWDDHELIERLYGIGLEDGHLDECEQCAERFGALRSARQQVLAPPSVSDELMVRQRQAIWRSLETPGRDRRWLSFGSAVATAAVLLLAVLLYRPAPAPTASGLPSDAEIFAEAYSLASSSEPLATEPIRALFEEEQ